jgi:hypothetical protein
MKACSANRFSLGLAAVHMDHSAGLITALLPCALDRIPEAFRLLGLGVNEQISGVNQQNPGTSQSD